MQTVNYTPEQADEIARHVAEKGYYVDPDRLGAHGLKVERDLSAHVEAGYMIHAADQMAGLLETLKGVLG